MTKWYCELWCIGSFIPQMFENCDNRANLHAKMKLTMFVWSSPFSGSICWLLFRDCSISKNLPANHEKWNSHYNYYITTTSWVQVRAHVCVSEWNRPASERLSSPWRTSGGGQGTSKLHPMDWPPRKHTQHRVNSKLSKLLTYARSRYVFHSPRVAPLGWIFPSLPVSSPPHSVAAVVGTAAVVSEACFLCILIWKKTW